MSRLILPGTPPRPSSLTLGLAPTRLAGEEGERVRFGVTAQTVPLLTLEPLIGLCFLDRALSPLIG